MTRTDDPLKLLVLATHSAAERKFRRPGRNPWQPISFELGGLAPLIRP